MLNTVDLPLLKKQKATLAQICHHGAHRRSHTVIINAKGIAHLDGLLHLLDTVQDGIADCGTVTLQRGADGSGKI